MKCPKCETEYQESFKFCPNCAEANPVNKLAESPVPTSSSTHFSVDTQEVKPPEEPKKEKKKLSEKFKPLLSKGREKSIAIGKKIKEKTNKKTVLIGAGVIVLIVALIVVAVILTQPSYPATIQLGSIKEGTSPFVT